jgi:hypothetical protein
MSQGREEDRHLRGVQWQVLNARGLGNALRSYRCLGIDIVQIGSTVSGGERAQRVEMQEVGSLEVAIAIAEPGSLDGPDVERP